MSEYKLFILLKTIRQHKNLNALLRAGLSFKNIAEFTDVAAKQELLAINEDGIVLTQLGHEKLEKLEKKFKRTDKNQWIDKEISSQIPKLDANFIFLPDQSDAFFLGELL